MTTTSDERPADLNNEHEVDADLLAFCREEKMRRAEAASPSRAQVAARLFGFYRVKPFGRIDSNYRRGKR